jgi:hypothetical protein
MSGKYPHRKRQITEAQWRAWQDRLMAKEVRRFERRMARESVSAFDPIQSPSWVRGCLPWLGVLGMVVVAVLVLSFLIGGQVGLGP